MKLFIKMVVATVLFSIATLCYANASGDLSSLLGNIKTMQADFTQTIADSRNKVVQQSTGSMALSRPGKFRWEVKQPIPQLIIANESKLWIYDPDLQQVTIRNMDKAASGTPGILLSKTDTALDNDFYVSEVNKNNPGWRWFKLTPKGKEAMFASIELGFNKDQISQMQLVDNLGHNTQITYQNIKTNSSLSAQLFVFKPSGKVDTIDETKQKTSKKS